MDVITGNFPDVPIVPLKSVGGQVLRGNRRQLSQAFGTTPQLIKVANLTVARGRYLTQSDLDDRLAVAVIGREVAKELFPFDDPLGATFRIDQKVFTVVGLLEPVGLSGGAGAALVGRDLNLDIHIPITSAKAMFGDMVVRRESGSFQASEVQVSEIYVVAPSREVVVSLAERVRRVLNVLHPQMTDIGIIVPYELLREAREKAMRWQIVLGAIAGISLLVGGIGIMNIMLATVTERTREIGIRRALGATRRHIVWQFLVETGVLSVAGGLIGIAIGVGASMGLSEFIEQVQSQVTGWSIILAFIVAVATGLVFGIYPAIRAAKQDPIVALRHD
jgi:putative ABC transport system permease protein